MTDRFQDRHEAGQLLAASLGAYTDARNTIVLGLPRGGVPVAAEVARVLRLPLDVFVVRKLGLPGHPELAMGAIATGGVRVLNRDVVAAARVPESVIDRVTGEEQRELERRESAYRDDLPPPQVQGKTVILVDDGVATGSTMAAAVSALRQLQAARIIVATPTIALTTFHEMQVVADEVVAVLIPIDFYGVGQWYENFAQTTDEEVRALLAEAI
jgi:predicted phosphoribosyltransferase